jgi:soluble lytic murein transglycosylase-like protein
MRLKQEHRIICDCQRHRQQNAWRRTLRIVSRGAAVLIGVPLAFAAFDFPIEAMNLDIARQPRKAYDSAKATVMPMFTTPRAREQFLDPRPQRLTLEIVKEQFFGRHVPYGAIIYRESLRNNLQPELVAAIIQTESDFRVGLVSHKSAQGLMQIVPETARKLGISDPFDPHENIAAGTRYLRYLMDRFPDQRLALAAYNAGETRVARLGTIPQYDETISYVEKVNARTRAYQQRVRKSYTVASRLRAAE